MVLPIVIGQTNTELFDRATKTWTPSISLPLALLCHRVVSINPPMNNKHFLIGGMTSDQAADVKANVYMYDWSNPGANWQPKVYNEHHH